MLTSRQAIEHTRTLLAAGAVRDAVIVLNRQTDHRFTALYRFEGDVLHNVILYDREDPAQTTTPDIPVMASYCVFVRDREETFGVADSRADDRVAGHPKRQQIRSYCGVPLLDDTGRMFGSICHFDFEPRAISDEAIETMEALAPALQRGASKAA